VLHFSVLCANTNQIAMRYEYGEGIEKDLVKAFEWYERASLCEHATATVNLGL
jgi:TPR repeat protein